MAESTTPSSSSSTSSSSSSAPLGQKEASKQYIRASVDDNALEPDAMRGSENLLKDLNLQDDEADRRKAISPDTTKS